MKATAPMLLALIASLGLSACEAESTAAKPGKANDTKSAEKPDAKPTVKSEPPKIYSDECISEAEVVAAQKGWGDGIVAIGKVFTEKGDYTKAATDHINKYYGYEMSKVLFKPTLAAEKQFRGSFDGALSYFVGGNESFPEDKGFAIKPWTKVRWENAGILNQSCHMAVAMGNYWFQPTEGDEVKVEYTFAYMKDPNGDLRIVAHKSALPFDPS